MRVYLGYLLVLFMVSVSAIHDMKSRRATTPKIRAVLDRLVSGMEMAQKAEDQAFENVKRECNVTEATSDETLARLKSALPEREKFATRKVRDVHLRSPIAPTKHTHTQFPSTGTRIRWS